MTFSKLAQIILLAVFKNQDIYLLFFHRLTENIEQKQLVKNGQVIAGCGLQPAPIFNPDY